VPVARKPVSGLDIAALVFSVIAAPVGVVLAVVVLVRARRLGKASIVSIVALWVGIAGSVLIVATVVIVTTAVQANNVAVSQAALCSRAAADPTLLDDIHAAVPAIVELGGVHIGGGPSDAEIQAAVSQIDSFASRVGVITTTYSDPARANDLDDWDNLYNGLENIKSDLTNKTVTSDLTSTSLDRVRSDLQSHCK
jgi:hypothetical protein